MTDAADTSIPRGLDGKPVERAHRSAFVEAYEQRPRYSKVVDMAAVLGHHLPNHDGSMLTRVCYRVATKAEEDSAIAAAHAYVDRLAKLAEGGAEQLRQDPDALNDAKARQALYRVCRDPENPDKTLFPTPSWMAEQLDTHTIAGLLNGYNEVRARKAGIPWDITDVSLDGTREMLVAAADTELPERLLAMFTREYLATLLTLICQRWDEDRRRAAGALRELLRGDPAGKPLAVKATALRDAEGLIDEWDPEPPRSDEDASGAAGAPEDGPDDENAS